jgi:hypothetical protein
MTWAQAKAGKERQHTENYPLIAAKTVGGQVGEDCGKMSWKLELDGGHGRKALGATVLISHVLPKKPANAGDALTIEGAANALTQIQITCNRWVYGKGS